MTPIPLFFWSAVYGHIGRPRSSHTLYPRRRQATTRWNSTAALAALLAAGCSKATLSVDDVIVPPGQPIELHAYIHRHGQLGNRLTLEDHAVTFSVAGRTLTGADLHKDGRICAQCETRLDPVTPFTAEAVVGGRRMATSGRIFVWQTDRPIIVCDIDGTISHTDFGSLLQNEADTGSTPLADSADELHRLARDYQLIYITQRPHFLLEETRGWLERWKFPAAPLVTSHRLRDLASAASYKTEAIAALRASWPNTLIGIGDQPTDAIAYGENGMLTLIVEHDPNRRYGSHALLMDDWKQITAFFGMNSGILRDRQRLAAAIAGRENLSIGVHPYREMKGPSE